jgi:hypothetical protein
MALTMRPEDWTHPALVELPWEHTAADAIGIHGITSKEIARQEDGGPVVYAVKCYCGWTFEGTTDRAAFDAIIAHAQAMQVRAGDLVEATIASSQPRTIRVRVDRQPWPVNERATTLSDGRTVIAVLTESIRVVEETAAKQV